MYSLFFFFLASSSLSSALIIQRVSPRASTPGDTSTVSAPQYQVFWTTVAAVNGQNMTLMIDTGSSDFWVHGPKAPNPKGSKGAKVMKGLTFNRDYANSPGAFIRGPVVLTKVSIGNISVPDMPVGVATEMGFGYPLDGFLGLGFKGVNSVQPTQQPTFMIAAQLQLREPVFTLNLKSSKDGKLTFGSVDKKQYRGDLMKSPVDEKGYPAWVAGRITLTSGKVKIMQPMLFDSGAGPTTYAVPRFVDNYWKQVPEARKIAQPSGLDQWIYPCVAKLPDVKVSIGETKSPVTIAGSKFKGPAVGPQAKGACTGHLQGDPYTILGNMGLPFFTSAFVVFNQAEPSISFAAQA